MNPILLGQILNPYTSPVGFTTLFTRLGHLLATINSINTYRGTTLAARANTIAADYTTTDQAEIDGLYANLLAWQNASSGFQGQVRTMARSVTAQMVQDVQPQGNQTYPTALAYLVTQMQDAGQTVKRCVVSSTSTTGAANLGNAALACATTTRMGVPTENVFAETITGTVVADHYTGGATAGRETLTFAGQYAVGDPLSWLWPAGSACSAVLSAVDAADNQAGGFANLLNNGTFEGAWSGDTPANWTVDVGTPGATVVRSTGTVYDGANALAFVGNGSELTSVFQAFNAAGGTTAALAPLTQYAVNLWLAVTGAPAAGTLEVALTDGTGNVLQDAAGAGALFTKNLVGMGATFVPLSGFLRTPRLLPAVVRLRLRLSAALLPGSVFLDRVAMAQAVGLYTQGPAVVVFSGSEPLVAGDTFALKVANDDGGGFQRGFDRVFGMRALGLLLPSTTGTPTLPDALIV